MTVFVLSLINHSMFACCIREVFLKSSDQNNTRCMGSRVHNHMCVTVFSSGSSTVDVNWKINLLSMVLRPYTTYMPCSSAMIPRSIMKENSCDNIDIRYNVVVHIYGSVQPYLFPHIVLKILDITWHFFNNSMIHLLC